MADTTKIETIVPAAKPPVAEQAAKPAVVASAPATPVAAKAAPVAAAKPVAEAKPVVAATKAAKPVARKAKPKARKAKRKAAVTPVKAVAKAAIKSNVKQIEKGTKTMNKQTQQAAQATQVVTERVQALLGDVSERAKVQLEKSTRIGEEFTDLGKGNVEALVAASKIAAKGVESLTQDVAEFGRKSFEDASLALKSFAEVKSPTDLFKLQSEFAKSAFEGFVAEGTKVSEAMIKLAGEVVEPITSRYSVAAERVKTIAA